MDPTQRGEGDFTQDNMQEVAEFVVERLHFFMREERGGVAIGRGREIGTDEDKGGTQAQRL